MLEFVAGVILGWAYLNGHRLPRNWFWGMIYIGLIMLALAPPLTLEWDPYRILFFGVPAAFIVTACVLTRDLEHRKVPELLVTLGASSYALYLSHPFTLGVITVIWKMLSLTELLGLALLPYFYVPVAMAICAFAGHMVHLLIEAPTTRYLGAKIRHQSKSAPPATPAYADR